MLAVSGSALMSGREVVGLVGLGVLYLVLCAFGAFGAFGDPLGVR